jgi:hypothetical protein
MDKDSSQMFSKAQQQRLWDEMLLALIKQDFLLHPSSKAKEITKRLKPIVQSTHTDKDLTQTDVNRVLHNHMDAFTKWESYIWTLKDTLLIPIDPESSSWISSSDLEDTLKNHVSLFGTPNKEIIFSLGNKKILLNAAAKLLAWCNQLCHRTNKLIVIDFSQCQGSAYAYLDRAGFFNQLDMRVKVIPERPASSRAITYQHNNKALLELCPIYTSDGKSNRAPEKLGESYEQNISNGKPSNLHGFIGELVGNVEEHAQSDTTPFVGLQTYSIGDDKKKISIIISDGGLGICGTLKPILSKHYPALATQFNSTAEDNDPKLLILAFQNGKISCTGEPERGEGFPSSNRTAKKLTDSIITIRQHNFEITLNYKNPDNLTTSWISGLSELSGTHISLDFFLTND